MQDELSLLIQLQAHDTGVDDIAEKLAEFDAAIKQKNSQFDALKQASKTAKENLTALQHKKKQLEGNVEAQEAQIKKLQSQLGSLKTNDAYKAMLTEIETAKAALGKIEDDVLVVMEQLDAADKTIKEAETKGKAQEAALKSEVQKIEGEKAVVTAAHQKALADRETFSATIPPAVKNQYNALRKNRGGMAIVVVTNSTCSGCRMKLTQNKMIEITKAKNMVLCDSCSRILYLPAVPKEEKAPTPTEAPAA